MFSPYYARRPGGDPADHVSINVALYGLSGPGWAMTERGRAHLTQTADRLIVGPSQMSWRGDTLTISIDEITVPLPRRLRGTITLSAGPRFGATYALDDQGHHHWTPLAPCARVSVAMDHPSWAWSGQGYLDTNHGDAPLASAFARWDWSRAALDDGSTVVIYDSLRRDGSRRALGLRLHRDGSTEYVIVPPRHDLPKGLWRMPGTAHGASPSLQRRLENGPFYTRSLIKTQIYGQCVTAIHESLSLNRFSKPWVQMLLPFRMPRRR